MQSLLIDPNASRSTTNPSNAHNDITRYYEQLAQYGYALRIHALFAIQYAQHLREWHQRAVSAPLPYYPAAAWTTPVAPVPPRILSDLPVAPAPGRPPPSRHRDTHPRR